MPRKSKTKPISPIMTLCETETSYCATVNGESVTVQKDAIEINNGIRNHPRLMAIEVAAKQAQIADWILFNV